MWEKLVQFGKELLTLKGQVKDNSSEIEEVRKELKELTKFVLALNNIVKQNQTKNEAEQAILIEKLKNALLQFENDLLRGKYPNMLDQAKDDED